MALRRFQRVAAALIQRIATGKFANKLMPD
jgi:hypothetical protein